MAWWIGWILLTIGSFFLSCFFWTRLIAERVGPIQKPGVAILWVTAVFGTWMILLVPLIVIMYQKVDKAYEDARIAREKESFERSKQQLGVKCILIEASQRLLKKELAQKLKQIPETIRRGHLVTAVLKNGVRIENVFVYNKRDVLGVYGLDRLTFDIGQITDVEPADLDHLPDFKPEQWLRLDGVGDLR